MATVAVFHPSFRVTPGITSAARRLRRAGHDVHVVDQYDGRTFDDYAVANDFVETIGFPALMQRAVDAVAGLPDDLVLLGFSNGAGMATHVATRRPVAGVVICSGATPLEVIGATAWPARVPAQLHATIGDPRRMPGAVESVMRSVNDAGADAEFHQYPGTGHLFADESVTGEYDAAVAERFWRHVQRFITDVSA